MVFCAQLSRRTFGVLSAGAFVEQSYWYSGGKGKFQGVNFTWARQAGRQAWFGLACVRACDVFPVLSANAHLTPTLNPLVFAFGAARKLVLAPCAQIKHARIHIVPETTARGFLESLSAVFSLFGYTCDRLFVDGSGDICASGSPLSPFSRVSSYRCANTSNLHRTT